MKKRIIVIGSGFSSLSAACYLAKQGYQVSIFEKNHTVGGRACQFKRSGFTFDMGPTWYWMPDVFERFFADFDVKPSDFYELQQLDPAYYVYFGKEDYISIGNSLEVILDTFEKEEPGSAEKLKKFISKAKENYNIAIRDLVYKPGISPLELINYTTLKKMGQFARSIKQEVGKYFKNKRLVQILEFPVLFLGAQPSNTPSFYNFMNYADFGLGTWYPKKGMYSVVEAMAALASKLGVNILTDTTVNSIITEKNQAVGINTNRGKFDADIIVSGADYHHTEQLLKKAHRSYNERYWNKKVLSPSALIFYIGINKKLQNLAHHTLFFDVDFEAYAHAIYNDPKWPEAPLFYASFPSMTDITAAPEGNEAGIFLIPLSPGLEDNDTLRALYFDKIITRFEHLTSQSIKNNIIFSESFCINDFIKKYNSYKGNAYGLANTLFQTAFFRPKLKSKKVKNLFFTGQLTVPGPGVPPALISGKLVAELIQNQYKKA